jgi:hypothetical protein
MACPISLYPLIHFQRLRINPVGPLFRSDPKRHVKMASFPHSNGVREMPNGLSRRSSLWVSQSAWSLFFLITIRRPTFPVSLILSNRLLPRYPLRVFSICGPQIVLHGLLIPFQPIMWDGGISRLKEPLWCHVLV